MSADNTEFTNNYCSKCGNKTMNQNFCGNCGMASITTNQLRKNKFVLKNHQKSPYWYLLPIYISIIGGVIAYFILKNTDNQKAKRSLIIGLLFSIPMLAGIYIELVYVEHPFYVVASGSMIPVFQVYDVLIVQGHEPFEDIQVGDIIAFNRPSDHDRVIVHRVASIIDDEPKTIRTKGDANPASIPGTDFPITKEEYIGKVVDVIPHIGYVSQLLKPPMNYIAILLQFVIVFGILRNKHQKYKKSQMK